MSLHDSKLAIEVKNLVVRYNRFVAVDKVSFKIRNGEIFGLLGPNGAGKTSVVKALTTLNSNCDGIANIHGFDIFREPSHVRKIICLVSQHNSLVTSLSGGQYRRLQLACMFLCDAKVYFLDEPSIGLDHKFKQTFWRFLRKTCEETGITIVLATNDLIEAEQMCDRIAFLNEGTGFSSKDRKTIQSSLIPRARDDNVEGGLIGLIINPPAFA